MQAKHLLMTGLTIGLLGSTPMLVFAYDGSETNSYKHYSSVSEERADLARQEADLSKEIGRLEEKRAALAERRAALPQAQGEAEAARHTSSLEREMAGLGAHETDRGYVLTLSDIQFQTDEAKLTADTMRKLYPFVTLLKDNPRREIIVEGYTDSSGPEDYNRELSEQRAKAVEDFLVSTGIDPRRITTHGYGETNPIASNATAAGRRENRRVEIVVSRGKQTAERER